MIASLNVMAAGAANGLAAAVWEGLLLTAAVAICLRLMPGISAAVRSLIWMAVFGVLLALHFVPLMQGVGGSGKAAAVHVGVGWSLGLAGVWVSLSLVRAGQLLMSGWALRGILRRAVPVERQVSEEFLLCVSGDVDRPSVIGFLRPRILLPAELLESLSAAELQQVLLHETEHLRRRDAWTNLLQKVALVVFPLNPALLWVERRLCLERELACDDRVLQATGARKAYATCLTSLAEHTLVRRGVSLALGAWSRQSELTRRVHRILRAQQQGMSGRQTAVASGLMMVALAAGGVELARAPRLVSFSPVRRVETAAETRPALVEQAGAQGARFVDASFRSTGVQARATLLKAVVPGLQSVPAPVSKAKKAARVRRMLIRQRPDVRAYAAEWDGQDAPRMVFTRVSGSEGSYTYVPAIAVAVPNGWLIFQL